MPVFARARARARARAGVCARVCARACARARVFAHRFARLEAARRADDPKLVAAARKGDPGAIRALGRIGGTDAVATLESVPVTPDTVEALWLTGDPQTALFLSKAFVTPDPATRAAILRALGAVTRDLTLPTIVDAMQDARPPLRAAATLALGVAARRKVTYPPLAVELLGKHAADPAPEVRYAIAYALANQPDATGNEDALHALAKDDAPETRALAVKGFGARGLDEARPLDDPDVNVRVEAVRALTSAKSTPDAHARVATFLVAELTSLGDTEMRLVSDRFQPILEGEARLYKFAKEAPVAQKFTDLAELSDVAHSTQKDRYTPLMLRGLDAVNCAAQAGVVRAGGKLEGLLECGEASGKGWPKWARVALAADTIDEGFGGTPAERAAALENLWKNEDLRARMAVAAAAVGLLPETEKIVTAGLAAGGPVLAATAESLGGHCDKLTPKLRAALEAHAEEKDPEIRQSVVDTIGKCKPGAASQSAASAPASQPAASQPSLPKRPPPAEIDPANVIGKQVRLTVVTSKGTFHVDLRPDVAPWNVATLAQLAGKGYFDGTVWHRVVPDFVAQGGDPTGTGAGGPGFEVPAEPSNLRYLRGTVGIADAGKDTGGSQWFVTLSPQPHLEGRYTIVGQVPAADMPVVDKLIVGDTMDKVTVEVK